MDKNQEWFRNWFDSPYYHLLYEHRDEEEAAFFLSNLFRFINPPVNSKILDLACGNGRHAIFLNTLGYDVTGADLSLNNISQANEFSGNNLRFIRHDMRNPVSFGKFDIILNLFTSIGYFEKSEDNEKTIKNMYDALTDNGIVVIDFFNADFISKNFIPEEKIVKSGIEFNITRYIKNNAMCKLITFKHHNHNYTFSERVSLLRLKDFEYFFSATKLQLIHTFGSYNLNAFNQEKSERLILIAKK